MSKWCVILLIISTYIVSSPATGKLGLLQRFKKGQPKQPEIVEKVYVVEEQPREPPCKTGKCQPKNPDYDDRPCKSDKCRSKSPDYVDDRPCRSDRCKSCRTECNGNERCQSDCIYVDKCRNNCNGNDKCIDECGGNRGYYVENDRCRSCPSGCPNSPPLITHCEPGKWLYYVQVPKTISLADFVSNPELIQTYNDSNMELDANGISGRACLSDKTRYELTRLNAAIMPIQYARK